MHSQEQFKYDSWSGFTVKVRVYCLGLCLLLGFTVWVSVYCAFNKLLFYKKLEPSKAHKRLPVPNTL